MGTSFEHAFSALGAPDAPATAAGRRHLPFRWPDLKRFAAVYAVLTVIAVAIGAAIVHVLGDGPFGELDLNTADWFADQRTHTVNHLAQIGAPEIFERFPLQGIELQIDLESGFELRQFRHEGQAGDQRSVPGRWWSRGAARCAAAVAGCQ